MYTRSFLSIYCTHKAVFDTQTLTMLALSRPKMLKHKVNSCTAPVVSVRLNTFSEYSVWLGTFAW